MTKARLRNLMKKLLTEDVKSFLDEIDVAGVMIDEAIKDIKPYKNRTSLTYEQRKRKTELYDAKDFLKYIVDDIENYKNRAFEMLDIKEDVPNVCIGNDIVNHIDIELEEQE